MADRYGDEDADALPAGSFSRWMVEIRGAVRVELERRDPRRAS